MRQANDEIESCNVPSRLYPDPANTIEQFPLAMDVYVRLIEVDELVEKMCASYTVADDVRHIVQANTELVVESVHLQYFGRLLGSPV